MNRSSVFQIRDSLPRARHAGRAQEPDPAGHEALRERDEEDDPEVPGRAFERDRDEAQERVGIDGMLDA